MAIANSKQMGSATPPIPFWLFGANIALLVLLSATAFAVYGTGVDGWSHVNRYVVRVSFTFFLLAFTARALVQFFPHPATHWLLSHRRYLGLNFALAHYIHLGALITQLTLAGQGADATTVIFGGFGYVLIAAMALTSTDRAFERLGANWHRLHTFGIYYLWFIFMFTYYGRVAGNDGAGYWFPILLGFVALALRLTATGQRRSRKTVRSS